MASAVREAIRTPARMESENVRDQHLEGGEQAVSVAFRRVPRATVAQGPEDWLAGFEADFRGNSYIYPADVQDRLTWSAGFIEGAAQRLQRVARIPITPQFILPLWWQQ
jgi:hypothetical protein